MKYRRRRRNNSQNIDIACIEALEQRMLFSVSGVNAAASVFRASAVHSNASLRVAPVFTTATAATFTENVAGSFTIDATDGGFSTPTPTLTLEGVLPTGLKFINNHNGTATISGTPSAMAVGQSTIAVQAKNSAGTVDQTITLTVQGPPTITSLDAVSFTAGGANSFTIATTGSPAVTVSVFSGTLPSGVTLSSGGSGGRGGGGGVTLSGTPVSGSGGVYPIVLAATNSQGTVYQDLTLTVGQTPTFTSATTATFEAGTSNSFEIVTNSYPYPRFVVSSLPPGLTLTDNGNGTATISGTPTTKTVGKHEITIDAKIGSAVVSKEVLNLQIDATPVSVVNVPGTADIFNAAGGGTAPPEVTFTPGAGQVLTISNVMGTVFSPLPESATYLTEAGTTVTVTVPSASGLEPGSVVTISGATPSGYNGTYTITGVSGNSFTYTAASGLGAALDVTSLTESGTTVTATVAATTGITVGSSVFISGANPSGYDGSFVVTGVSGTTFTYTAGASNLVPAQMSVTSMAAVGTTVTATVGSTTGLTVGEGITIAGATPGGYNGTYTVTGVTPTTLTYTASVMPLSVTSLTETGTTVTGTVPSTAGLTSGQTITISGADQAAYNGTFTVTVIDGMTFSYTDTGGLTSPATGTIIANPQITGTITATPTAGGTITASAETTGNIAILSSTPVGVSFLTEAGTVVTATLPSTTGISVGSTVTIAGASIEGYNGTFTVTAVTPTTFSYVAGTGLSTNLTVTSLSETGMIASVNVASTVGVSVGQAITISGAQQSGYNGTFAVTGVSGNQITYNAPVSGLATETGAITATIGAGGSVSAIPETDTGAGATGYTSFNGISATTDISAAGGLSGIVDNNAGLFLVGVFLDNGAPVSPAPASLDVSKSSKATKVTPLLNQVFYIGTGQTPTGQEQQFVVPPTADELYLGFADAVDVAHNNLEFHGTPSSGAYSANSGSLTATLTIGPAKT